MRKIKWYMSFMVSQSVAHQRVAACICMYVTLYTISQVWTAKPDNFSFLHCVDLSINLGYQCKSKQNLLVTLWFLTLQQVISNLQAGQMAQLIQKIDYSHSTSHIQSNPGLAGSSDEERYFQAVWPSFHWSNNVKALKVTHTTDQWKSSRLRLRQDIFIAPFPE